MRKLLLLIPAFFIAGIIFNGCQESVDINQPQSLKKIDGSCGETIWDLTAGQYTVIGTLTVENDQDNIYVTYTLTNNSYPFGTLHLWVGDDLNNMPTNPQGTPVPGQFPYQYDATGMTEYTFTIPFSALNIQNVQDVCGANLYVVAHAEAGTETAFGGDIPVDVGQSGRWYYYGEYSICCDFPDPPVISSCETAFAKGGYVWTTSNKSNPEGLPSLELTKNRWGWAINIPNEFENGSYDIWAGAGLNKTENGTLVGTLNVTKSGSSITVEYELSEGYTMGELHIYAGDLAPATIAPGQYGHTVYFDPRESSYEYTFDGLTDTNNDGIWIVAHAVVCWE